jgi:hypothetical protein
MNAHQRPAEESDRSPQFRNRVFCVLAVAATAWAYSGVSIKDVWMLLSR